ncbi:hypothetical protein [Vibrio gazogenes]|uniref:hypothetical protein n=1 Tax=Vibrio gazogenes TaxID=687 RepID=UPI0012FDE9BD|nr:hypothetical protein [Vibrio gazogenes]
MMVQKDVLGVGYHQILMTFNGQLNDGLFRDVELFFSLMAKTLGFIRVRLAE